MPDRKHILDAIDAERERQDSKWGGAAHDDEHSTAEFVQFIEDYAGWARTMAGMNSPDKARQRLIQVAALAVAAVESLDRRAAVRRAAVDSVRRDLAEASRIFKALNANVFPTPPPLGIALTAPHATENDVPGILRYLLSVLPAGAVRDAIETALKTTEGTIK